MPFEGVECDKDMAALETHTSNKQMGPGLREPQQKSRGKGIACSGGSHDHVLRQGRSQGFHPAF